MLLPCMNDLCVVKIPAMVLVPLRGGETRRGGGVRCWDDAGGVLLKLSGTPSIIIISSCLLCNRRRLELCPLVPEIVRGARHEILSAALVLLPSSPNWFTCNR